MKRCELLAKTGTTFECHGTRFKDEAWPWFVLAWRIGDTGLALDFAAWMIDTDPDVLAEDGELTAGEPWLSGYLKWDGCMNIDSPTHFCGLDELLATAELTAYIYSLGATIIEAREPPLC